MPCDSPFLPADLVARLAAAMKPQDAELAVASTGRPAAPGVLAGAPRVLPHLTHFLEGGGRKIDAWYATLRIVEVAFDDEADAFRNINTLDELRQAAMHETMTATPKTLRDASCADDYDPNSMPVAKARELIRDVPDADDAPSSACMCATRSAACSPPT